MGYRVLSPADARRRPPNQMRVPNTDLAAQPGATTPGNQQVPGTRFSTPICGSRTSARALHMAR